MTPNHTHHPIRHDDRGAQAELMRRRRAEAREIEIPQVVNPERKEACRHDLVRFVQTYFSQPPDPERLPGQRGLSYLPLSPLHEMILREFQTLILYGGQEAWAAPRGFGKDTTGIEATLWAVLYGHSRFVVIACYEQSEAERRIDMIKAQLEVNSWLLEDFPEVCAPVRALNRAAQRARQQTYRGEFTRVEWGATIVLPAIPGSAASGGIIAPASLSGSVRGMIKNGTRPSFVIISDPQTDEVAKSKTQIEDTMRRIRQDFGGLGAVDQPLSCLALVTIIRRYDVADQLTDVRENPQWSGQRFRAIDAWPERMDLWDRYEALLEQGKREGDRTGRTAHRFYLEHRAEMDRGARVTWEAAYIQTPTPDGSPLEASALQHFMNLRWRWGEAAFSSEYQNEPPEEETINHLTPELVAARLSSYPPGVAPSGCDHLVQAVDIGGREIHYAVLAVNDEGTGSVIDYGRIAVDAPEGDLADPNAAIRPALERAILAALRKRRDEISAAASPYKTAEGKPLEISLTLVDAGWLGPEVVYPFVRESGPRWRASKGDQAAPGSRRYSHPARSTRDMRVGQSHHWHCRRQAGGTWLWHLDADRWKLHVQERFAQTPGTVGAWTLYGTEPREHRMFGKHICAEAWDPAQGRFERRSKWNHFLDCAAGCGAAASMVGARLVTGGEEPPDDEARAWASICR